jgi:hypothetical protein
MTNIKSITVGTVHVKGHGEAPHEAYCGIDLWNKVEETPRPVSCLRCLLKAMKAGIISEDEAKLTPAYKKLFK